MFFFIAASVSQTTVIKTRREYNNSRPSGPPVITAVALGFERRDDKNLCFYAERGKNHEKTSNLPNDGGPRRGRDNDGIVVVMMCLYRHYHTRGRNRCVQSPPEYTAADSDYNGRASVTPVARARRRRDG